MRRLLEALFSINIALLIMPVVSEQTKFPVVRAGRYLVNVFYRHLLFLVWNWRNYDQNMKYLASLVLTLAAVLFVILLASAKLAITTATLRFVPGVVAVAGFPAACWRLQIVGWPIMVEAALVTTCIVLYLFGKIKLSFVASLFLFALHFALWAPAGYGRLWFWWAYPLVGFSSALVWLLYRTKQTDNNGSGRVAHA